MESLWGLATIVGPILLLAVIVWAWASNRKRGAASERQADAGAARLYDRIQDEDERKGND
jgi:cbb3-type cytochrome oxidase subunit 3